MDGTKLPPELVSLIHHVELNKAGWWEKGLQRFVIATIWLSRKVLTRQGIAAGLQEKFSINLSLERIGKQVDALCRSDTLVCLPDGRLKISESALGEFERGVKEAEEIEEAAKRKFVQILGEYCSTLDADRMWSQFNDGFLFPLVREV